jgi:hypothetical protein
MIPQQVFDKTAADHATANKSDSYSFHKLDMKPE